MAAPLARPRGPATQQGDTRHRHYRRDPRSRRCTDESTPLPGLAGAQILEETPHAIDDVREVLVHEGFETARRHYRAENAKGAARRFTDLISRKRKLSRRKPSGTHLVPSGPPPRRRWRT